MMNKDSKSSKDRIYRHKSLDDIVKDVLKLKNVSLEDILEINYMVRLIKDLERRELEDTEKEIN